MPSLLSDRGPLVAEEGEDVASGDANLVNVAEVVMAVTAGDVGANAGKHQLASPPPSSILQIFTSSSAQGMGLWFMSGLWLHVEVLLRMAMERIGTHPPVQVNVVDLSTIYFFLDVLCCLVSCAWQPSRLPMVALRILLNTMCPPPPSLEVRMDPSIDLSCSHILSWLNQLSYMQCPYILSDQ